MCTALNYVNGHHLFGRNLDLETDYPVGSLIMPRKYPLALRNGTTVENHYATLGVGMKSAAFHCILMPSTKKVWAVKTWRFSAWRISLTRRKEKQHRIL